MHAILSALRIAIGITTMLSVVGISASSQARPNDELASLGTNPLTTQTGTDFTGLQVPLPADSIGRTAMINGVEKSAAPHVVDRV